MSNKNFKIKNVLLTIFRQIGVHLYFYTDKLEIPKTTQPKIIVEILITSQSLHDHKIARNPLVLYEYLRYGQTAI